MLRLLKKQSNVIDPWSKVFATVFATVVSTIVMGLLTACASAAASQPTPAITRTPVTNPGEKPTIDTVETSNRVIEYTYEIVDKFPHDPAAFTQGLIYTDGIFYEGTGLYGQSTLRKVDPETG